MNINVNIGVVKGEHYDPEEAMTIEVLKSMAKEGQVFSLIIFIKKLKLKERFFRDPLSTGGPWFYREN